MKVKILRDNPTAVTLQIIGYLGIIAAFIVTLFVDTEDLFGVDLSSELMIGAFITLAIFEGLAEIIELLYKNGKKQDAIIELLKDITAKSDKTPTSLEQDIESNLPEM